ncbi:MAG: peptide deformylase [Bacteroidales bacterium]
MNLPIIAYGHNILRKQCREISQDDQTLNEFISDLWESLDRNGGVGLAAPQVNKDLKTFIVNSKLMYDDLSADQKTSFFREDEGITETFLNAEIVSKSEKVWSEDESCLSIPGIEEPVNRSWGIVIKYQDHNFNHHRKTFSGFTAKVIQHEYDHTRGVLFIDYLPSLKKRLIRSKLKRILDGKVKTKYPIKFVRKNKTLHRS